MDIVSEGQPVITGAEVDVNIPSDVHIADDHFVIASSASNPKKSHDVDVSQCVLVSVCDTEVLPSADIVGQKRISSAVVHVNENITSGFDAKHQHRISSRFWKHIDVDIHSDPLISCGARVIGDRLQLLSDAVRCICRNVELGLIMNGYPVVASARIHPKTPGDVETLIDIQADKIVSAFRPDKHVAADVYSSRAQVIVVVIQDQRIGSCSRVYTDVAGRDRCHRSDCRLQNIIAVAQSGCEIPQITDGKDDRSTGWRRVVSEFDARAIAPFDGEFTERAYVQENIVAAIVAYQR